MNGLHVLAMEIALNYLEGRSVQEKLGSDIVSASFDFGVSDSIQSMEHLHLWFACV